MGITDWSVTPGNNTTLEGVSWAEGMDPGAVNDGIRAIAAAIKAGVGYKGANIASATSINLGSATGQFVDITGSTNISSLGTADAGTWRVARFTGALSLIYNATSLILPEQKNFTTVSGDMAAFLSLGSGNWIMALHQRTSPSITNSGSVVTLAASADLVTNGQTSYDTGAGTGTATTDQLALRSGTSLVSQATTRSNIFLSKKNVSTNSEMARFSVNGSLVGTITVTASATAYNTSSDESLKENIRPTTEDGIAWVKALAVRDFEWKATGQRETGFVAQELRQVLPEAVSEDDGLLVYEKAALVPMLVRTIQQLVERVEALEAR